MLASWVAWADCARLRLRLQAASNYKKQVQLYKAASVYQAAAALWVEGVPWDTALQLSEDAATKADPHSKGIGQGKGKSRGGRGKGKSRGSGG